MVTSQLPKGPQNLSLLNKLQRIIKPLEFLETCARKYGDIFTLPVLLGSSKQSMVIISNPQGIKEIFSTDPEKLDAGGNGARFPFLGEQSILALSGDRHQRQRKLLTPPFHGQRMIAYGELIREIIEQVTSQWTTNKTFPIRSSTQRISFQVILKAVFGLEEGQRLQEIDRLLTLRFEGRKSIFRSILLFFPALQKDWGPLSPWGRLMQNERDIDKLIYAEIAERRENPDPTRTDILSLMMGARDEEGQPMTDVELRDELITLLFAGHETTATSLAWAFYWIHRQPEVREKLLQELDALGNSPDPMEIFKLPYLDAVCKETLRIYPVVILAMQRQVKSPLEIMGYKFEPGIFLSPCIYLTHHREDLYPQPKQFRPERFLERQYSPYEYMPFGGGNRRCIGMAFALFEMKLVLATILSSWELALADEKPVKAVRRGLLMAPSDGVRMVVKGKRTPVRIPGDSRENSLATTL
ncbi:MAG: cytochrome P450 [Trichodesmium sp. MO_231.B1]|nr:cytochrome P450 [Trichodesmium sp. MO_231.B1]